MGGVAFFREITFFVFIIIRDFFEFSLFLVDFGVFWLHFGPQKTLLGRPGRWVPTGPDPPFSHVFSQGPPGVDLGASGGGLGASGGGF